MTFSNCQVEEEIVNETNQVALQYNEQVLLYLDQLKSKGTKDKSSKINALIAQMDSNSLKTFNLNTTQQILIADVLSLPKLEDQTKIKLVFFLYENKIIRSRIISFSNKNNVTDYNTLVLSVLNATKDKKPYTGTVSFYNPFQEIIQKNKYENGIMIENQVLSITSNDINAKTNGCIEWYWVTTYASGRQTWDYMYTTCSCEENTYRVSTCGGGGGGGNGNTPSFPQVPTENQIIDFFSPEGEFIRYQFINNTWKIVLINLADVIVKTKPGKYSFLIFNYPVNQQKVYNDGMVYTFESEINTWSGVIATDELIAQDIEDQIDDSKLDPCPKGVMAQLKKINNYDIAQVLAKLDANKSIYNTTMISAVTPSGNPAQTIRTSAYNYKIYISTDYENKTKLFIASLQLHELVHANFFSLIDDCLIQNNCQLLVTFPELWEYYVSVCDNQYPSNPSSHHEQIANSYVTAISVALQEYQPGLPQQVYEDLAWNGLEGTTVFNTLHPIGSASRQRILNRKAAEQSGHPIAEGTSQEQINYGKPCN